MSTIDVGDRYNWRQKMYTISVVTNIPGLSPTSVYLETSIPTWKHFNALHNWMDVFKVSFPSYVSNLTMTRFLTRISRIPVFICNLFFFDYFWIFWEYFIIPRSKRKSVGFQFWNEDLENLNFREFFRRTRKFPGEEF